MVHLVHDVAPVVVVILPDAQAVHVAEPSSAA